MNKCKRWLGGLLALQLLLVVGIFWSVQNANQQIEQQPLLSFDVDKVNRLVITSGEQSVTLNKNGEQWQLPDLNGLRANDNKIDSILKKLSELKTNWAVTTTQSSHDRFEVSEQNFQRRIQLHKGDELVGDVLLGTSPGFRKSHVRRINEDDIYALELNSYDFPDKKDDWLDKSLLSAKTVTSIKGPEFMLTKANDQWRLEGYDEDNTDSVETDAATTEDTAATESTPTELDNNKIGQWVQAFSSLKVTGVVEKEPEITSTDVKVFELMGDNGGSYQFFSKDNKHYVKRDDLQTLFALSENDYNRIAGVTRSDFIKPVEVPSVLTNENLEASDS